MSAENKTENKKDSSLSIRALKYCFREIWQNKKSYLFISAANVLLSAAVPFAQILLMPVLINTLLAPEKDFKQAAVIAAAMIISQLVLEGLSSCITVHLEKYADFFLNLEAEKLARLCMEIDFMLTEDTEALDQRKKAREGLDWSGGAHEIAKGFFTIVSNALTLFGVISVIVLSAPILLVIIGAVLVVLAIINGRKNKIDIEFFKELASINRIFWYVCNEMEFFQYGKDIRLYGAADMMLGKASQQMDRMIGNNQNMNDKKYPLDCAGIAANSVRVFGTYFYPGVLAIMGKITIGTFSQLLTAGEILHNALQAITMGFQDIMKRSGYFCEIIKFMEYPPALEKGTKKIESGKNGHEIEFRNVSFSYPNTGVEVLKNVSIRLKSGERLSVVGLNGAGKTTFIKLLCRLYDVDSGEILLDGVNIREYDYEEYMKLFSVVFQDFVLLAFSAQDNILLGGEDSPENVDELFRTVGLLDKINSLPNGRDTMMFKMFDKEGVELSGGEQQKMAIARALYKNAPVVILDEPTAALDPVAEYEIYRQFNDLVGGKTAVYISHRLSSCKFCEHIAVFSEGTIKEYGTHDELVRKPDGIYAEMFKAQAQYYI